MAAAQGSSCELVTLLLDRRADLHATSAKGWDAMMWACSAGAEAVARLLLRSGAATHVVGADGATALSLAVVCNFGLNLLVAITLEPLQGAFDALAPCRGQAYLFLSYASLCVASLAFVRALVPETKGKSLEQIEAMLRAG